MTPKPNKNSDTPETDARQRVVLGGVGGDWKVVLADFARKLERERNEARAEVARLQMELDASCNAEELRQVREENARLRAELEINTQEIDSYGEPGSNFRICTYCHAESGAGFLDKGIPHEETCILHTKP